MENFYIEISGEKISVSEEIYKAYNQSKWREKKQNIRTQLKQQYICNEKIDCFTSDKNLVEDIVTKKLFYDEFYRAFESMTTDEKEIIQLIFFHGMTEREVAKKIKNSPSTIHSKKAQIIAKLRSFLS